MIELNLFRLSPQLSCVARGVAPYGCLTDPLLDAGRYVYVRCALATLLALARGRQDWHGAVSDGSLTATGAPDLSRRAAEWFAPVTAPVG